MCNKEHMSSSISWSPDKNYLSLGKTKAKFKEKRAFHGHPKFGVECDDPIKFYFLSAKIYIL